MSFSRKDAKFFLADTAGKKSADYRGVFSAKFAVIFAKSAGKFFVAIGVAR
jgi:hypothetical protein